MLCIGTRCQIYLYAYASKKPDNCLRDCFIIDIAIVRGVESNRKALRIPRLTQKRFCFLNIGL
ncbi:MAG: hypothetical protein GAK38_04239 [Xylophilus sp.]|nr:MAG: hypothetical protein GAK38_04239 [Xylophilus sp.]